MATALIAAAVSAAVSIAVAWAQLLQGRASQRAQSQQDITSKYDRMVDYRLQRPEVLALARRWETPCFDAIYDHSGPEGDAWAVYYGYIELVTFYCSAVLYARDKSLLDEDVYAAQHEPLIRLLLAEHYPILSSIVRDGGYVTKYLVNHVARLKKQGWDWEDAYERLVG